MRLSVGLEDADDLIDDLARGLKLRRREPEMLDVHGKAAYCYTGGKAFDPALPTVVFIHGAQNDHSVWALQSRWFAHHGWNVLAVDLPGHGRSGGAGQTSVEAMADWLLALLDAAGVAQALLVGHSMGSLIALEAAHRAPARQRPGHARHHLPDEGVGRLLAPRGRRAGRDRHGQHLVAFDDRAKPSSPAPGFSVMGGAPPDAAHVGSNPDQLFHTDFSACNAYANGEAAARRCAARCCSFSAQGHDDAAAFDQAADGALKHGKSCRWMPATR
jgi:pimeloyl-ACP methyl ester carboxylesterase